MAGLKSLATWLMEALQGKDGAAVVTPHTALTYPPIWYAVNKIAGHFGQLPCVLYKRLGEESGAEPDRKHRSYFVMKKRPNSWQTPIVYKEQMSCHSLLWGNAYSYIVKNGSQVSELLPLDPGSTAPYMIDGKKYYVHFPEDDDPILRHKRRDNTQSIDHGGSGKQITLSDDEVFHIPGLGFDGIAGKSLWRVASESWSIGIASDKRIKHGFEKGFKSAMLLEAPEGTFRKPDEAREFINDFNKHHSGSENADRAGLLTNGIKANVVAMNSQESQMVEHRRYQRQDAALWFLLEQILGDDSSVSYNSLEQKNLAYLSNCLMRWLVKWEEEANTKLLTEREFREDTHYFKFNTAALLRSDFKTTIESLGLAITSRIMNPNQAREKLDMNPYDGGDEYANPAITPGSAADEAEEPESDDAPTPNNLALRSRVSQLVRIEIQRVTDHTNAANFCEWLDGFYAKWETKLGNAMEELGGDRLLAERHCKESRRQLLDCAGKARTADELAAVVGECVANWEARVDGIATLMEQAVG